MNAKKVFGILLTAIGAGCLVYGQVKKRNKKREKKQEEEKSNVKEELGISDEKAENLVQSTEFVKSIFKGLHESDIENIDKIIDVDEALNGNIVHIIEEDGNLSFIVDIPNWIKDPKSPRIGDYIRSLNTTFSELSDKYGLTLRKELISYIALSYENEDKVVKSKIMALDSDIYSHYADEERDGLTAFYEDVLKNGYNLDKISKEKLLKKLEKDGINYSLKDIVLSFKFSFKIKEDLLDMSGITLSDTFKFIEDLTSDKYNCITRRDSSVKFIKHLMFHKNSLIEYYDYDSENEKITVEELYY